MILLSSLFAAAITLTLSGCITPMVHQKKQIQIEAAGIDTFIANTGAGDLKIQGVDGLTQITVIADIYTYGDIKADLTLEKNGLHAKLVADFDNNINFSRSPYIDLTIQVPATMMLTLEDGSGDIDIQGVAANINLDDGSGDLWIKGGQQLNIVDGSGTIEISHTTGNLTLEDGSGSIMLKGIGGNAKIEDGSGDMSVHNVNGHVTIDDGSGDIDVDNTKGLSIIESGSGDLSVDHINGSVSMN